MISVWILVSGIVFIIGLKVFFRNEEVWPVTFGSAMRKAAHELAKAFSNLAPTMREASESFRRFGEELYKAQKEMVKK